MSYFNRLFKNIKQHYKEDGISGLLRKVPEHSRFIIKRLIYPELDYQYWLNKNEDIVIENYLSATEIEYTPKISILAPLFNVPPKYFKKCVRSVQNQTYENWELCIHNDASTENLSNLKYAEALSKEDKRVKYSTSDINENISGSMNHTLKLATGEYVIILDNDDELHPRALEMLIRKLNSDRKLRYIYTDEDKMELNDKRTQPLFKPDWAPHYTMSMMYTTHISMFETKLMKEIGGLRKGFEAAQDYDLVLRYTEQIDNSQVGHIPLVLYHWRKIPGSTAIDYDAKGAAKHAARKALEEAVERRKLDARVEDGMTKPSFRIRYKIMGEPLISIIIPTHNQWEVLNTCIDSILDKTKYKNFEILVVNNNSNDADTLRYLEQLNEEDKVRVLEYPKKFNFSAINNFGVEKSSGEYVLLLNNDTEVINGDWLSSMLELAQLPEVGAVGGMLLYPNNTYQHTGIVTGINGVAGHSFREHKKSYAGPLGEAHVIRNVSGVTAACLLINKQKYLEVGGLNEDLRVAFNDVDFCLELDKKGYYNIYTPYARLYHFESLSRGSDQSPKRRPEFKREINFMKKKWGDRLRNDPYYNPNLTLKYEDFTLRVEKK